MAWRACKQTKTKQGDTEITEMQDDQPPFVLLELLAGIATPERNCYCFSGSTNQGTRTQMKAEPRGLKYHL